MAAYIAVGSALGAYAAALMPGAVLRVVFIVYIVGVIVDCVFRKGFIDLAGLQAAGRALEKTEYGQYLLALAREVG